MKNYYYATKILHAFFLMTTSWPRVFTCFANLNPLLSGALSVNQVGPEMRTSVAGIPIWISHQKLRWISYWHFCIEITANERRIVERENLYLSIHYLTQFQIHFLFCLFRANLLLNRLENKSTWILFRLPVHPSPIFKALNPSKHSAWLLIVTEPTGQPLLISETT